MRNFTDTNAPWENYGDGVGALTGGGNAIKQPSAPNVLETLLDPIRRNKGEPFVPLPPAGRKTCPANDELRPLTQ
jgi:hypothetical protein